MNLNIIHIICVILIAGFLFFVFFYVIGPYIWKLGRQNYHLELSSVFRQMWLQCYGDYTTTFLKKLFLDHFKIKASIKTVYIIYLCYSTLQLLTLYRHLFAIVRRSFYGHRIHSVWD